VLARPAAAPSRSTPPVTMTLARLFTASLVLAALAPPARAVEAPPTILTCGEVSAFYGRWLITGEPLTRIVVTGSVTGLAAEEDRGYTYVCPVPGLRVVCVEQSVAGLSVGDVVTVEGVVLHGLDTELWLDPCGSIRRE
jgi:hypothetical protein